MRGGKVVALRKPGELRSHHPSPSFPLPVEGRGRPAGSGATLSAAEYWFWRKAQRERRLLWLIMEDIKNRKLIWCKGGLFLLLGVGSSILLMLQAPTLSVCLLLMLSVWAFCRAYYFAFYVIERYVDSSYRFSGLISFARYALRKNRSPEGPEASSSGEKTRKQ